MAEAYGKKLGDIVNSTFVTFALSLAKDTGVLQTLVEAKQALTSHEIADKRQLKERYVREILNCLTTAELLQASNNELGSLVYSIEEVNKPVFNTSIMAFISGPKTLSDVYRTVRSCVYKSGPHGTRYSDEAHNFIEEFSIHNQPAFEEKITRCVDGLKERLETGIDVIEFGCGRGRLLAKLAESFPKSTFTASEYIPDLLDQLKEKLGHIQNIKYEIADLCNLPEVPAKQYDWVYCVDVIHDLPNPAEALKGIRRLVRESGVFVMFDIATSGSPLLDKGNLDVASLYAASTFLCIPESFQNKNSHALGACWGTPTAVNLATQAGFDVQVIDAGNLQALYVCRPKV